MLKFMHVGLRLTVISYHRPQSGVIIHAFIPSCPSQDYHKPLTCGFKMLLPSL